LSIISIESKIISFIIVSDKILFINKINLNKEFMKIKETKDNFNTKFLPLTTNENNFGKLLIKGDCLPYIDKIKNQRETVYKDKMNTEYINTMYLYKNTYVIINKKKTKENYFIREIYSANTDALFKTVSSTVLNKNTFIRKIGKVSLTISNYKVINVEALKKLSTIK